MSIKSFEILYFLIFFNWWKKNNNFCSIRNSVLGSANSCQTLKAATREPVDRAVAVFWESFLFASLSVGQGRWGARLEHRFCVVPSSCRMQCTPRVRVRSRPAGRRSRCLVSVYSAVKWVSLLGKYVYSWSDPYTNVEGATVSGSGEVERSWVVSVARLVGQARAPNMVYWCAVLPPPTAVRAPPCRDARYNLSAVSGRMRNNCVSVILFIIIILSILSSAGAMEIFCLRISASLFSVNYL